MRWNDDFPDTKSILRHGCRLPVPPISNGSLISLAGSEEGVAHTEVPDKIGTCGIRCPFSVYDVAVWLDVETELKIAFTECFKASFMLDDILEPLVCLAVAASEGIFEGV